MVAIRKIDQKLPLFEDGVPASPAVRARRRSRPAPQLTTSQRLASIIKSARDIMRKDKGLNGDLDRLPMLTWIMFLKFLDDMEHVREAEAVVAGESFRPAIDPPYRWRDWAAKPEGITGDELIAFVNDEKAWRPDGTEGPGLFTYLRTLQGVEGGDRRDVVATVFKGTINRMINGYLLRDVINKVGEIHFASSAEIQVLGNLYESMLKEMRDSAGDSGEFYTPRPVVQFMVEVVDPKLGEVVYDPAAGTGGFLAIAFNHLEEQAQTVEDREILQRRSIYGGEPKPLPYLMAQMNLLLHGLESPQIDPGNSLRFPLREIGERDRVDVILTNPPFGGEEERGILSNFPEDKQTAETALLFLQLIMRKIHRTPRPGRAAVVVPNGTLFGDGVAGRIKEELLKDFNLHTIVRLPIGVFAPYTPIPTNILFFDRTGPTKEVWYYEHQVPGGRNSYTKTASVTFDDFSDCIAWWHDRKENGQAWKVSAADLLANGCNLDQKNPRGVPDLAHMPPADIAGEVVANTERTVAAINAITPGLSALGQRESVKRVSLGEILTPVSRREAVDPEGTYCLLGARWYAKGLYVKDTKLGSQIQAKDLYKVHKGDFVYNRLFAWKGSFAVAGDDADGCYVSNEFPCFEVDQSQADARYVWWYFRRPETWNEALGLSSGGTPTSRNRLKEARLLAMKMPLPSLDEQRNTVELLQQIDDLRAMQDQTLADVDALLSSSLKRALRVETAR